MPRVRRAIISLAAMALAYAVAAPAAQAGQIVWLAGGGGGGALWAANDDGTYPHKIVASTSTALSTALPGGTLGSPDVFQRGGSTVLFTDTVNAFGAPSTPALCAQPCALAYSLTAGVLTAQSPAPGAAGAAFESQPRLTAGGQLVERYTSYPAATSGSLGNPSVDALFARPLGLPSSIGAVWSDTATATLPPSPDPAPDPVNASLVAWVENQDPACTRFTVAGSAVCQYAVHISSATSTSPPVAIFDDETPFGAGPSSLAWSSDGRNLLIVDDQAPNDGIYEVSASTSVAPATKHVTEVLAEPPGWTFGQARFAGSKIVFDAQGGGHGAAGTSDIYTIPANCDAGTCSFPASATNVTHNPSQDNVDPAWTSAAAPLAALGSPPVAGAPPALDAAAILSRTVTARAGVSFEVTMSVAGQLTVSISRNGHTIGTSTLRLPAGASTFAIKQSGGHPLTPGHDVAKLRIAGSTTVRYSASFTVR